MRLSALLAALCVAAPPVFAQTPQPQRVGPLSVQNALSEIAKGGPDIRAQARSNLGLGSLPTAVPNETTRAETRKGRRR
jgi:hypothetical protein